MQEILRSVSNERLNVEVNHEGYEVDSQHYKAVNHLTLTICFFDMTQHSDGGVLKLRIIDFVVVGILEILLLYGVINR